MTHEPSFHLSRRTLAKASLGTGLGIALSTAAVESATAKPANPQDARRARDLAARLLVEWQRSPGTHPVVGDFRYAGYRRGDDLPRPKRQENVRKHGAKGDGVTDDAAAINTAVRTVARRGGGVVWFPPGTYHLASPIWMHYSSVVLRGAGSGKTVLYFSRPLKEGYRNNWQETKSQDRWSWAGGQIWFVPEPVLRKLEGEEWLGTEGWIPGEELANVRGARRGDRVLTISSTRGLEPGRMILLETNNPGAPLLTHLAGDAPGAQQYDWINNAPQLVWNSTDFYPQYGKLQWPVRISRVLGRNRIEIAQPLKYDLRDEWPATIRELGPAVTESGVEGLTIRNKQLPQTTHNQNPGSNGVHFQASHDCWARDVRVEHCDVGFGMTGAKGITIRDTTIAGRASHHPYVIRMQSHDNLIEDFTIEPFTVPLAEGARLHGINSEGLSSGNVYRRGNMGEGIFDSHRALPFENLRTDITVANTGNVGGAAASGPLFGARANHWNIRVTQDRSYAICIGDVAPASATIGVTGVTTDSSGLRPDYPGGREALNSVTDLSAASVKDLYAAQRKRRGR